MRVVHVIGNLSAGGAEMMLYKLLKYANRGSFEPLVVSLQGDDPLGPKIKELGVEIVSLGAKNSFDVVRALPRLSGLLRRIQPHIIQSWMYHSNLFSLAARILSRHRCILIWMVRHSLHDIRYEKTLTQQVIRLGARVSSRVDRIVYNSQVSARQHQAYGYTSQNATIIANGFDLETFRPDPISRVQVRRKYKIPLESKVIGMIARYHPMKRHDLFLDAAAKIIQSNPEVRFLLAGKAVDEHNLHLRDLIERHQLRKYIRLIGERSNIAPIHAALDIECLTSAWGEGFPNVLGEAMACGVPCVATRVGDIQQIIGNTGFTIDPEDVDGLVEKCIKLLREDSDSRESRSLSARQRIAQHYSIDAITHSYERLYAECASK